MTPMVLIKRKQTNTNNKNPFGLPSSSGKPKTVNSISSTIPEKFETTSES
jgi:hypothetical protein